MQAAEDGASRYFFGIFFEALSFSDLDGEQSRIEP
jgi:hypothetical protein